MKTKLINTTGLFLMATLMVTSLNAQSYRQGSRGSVGYGHGSERVSAHLSLDLTTEQQEAMKSLRIDNYKTIKPLRNKMQELKARERTLISEESVDMKSVNKVIDEQTDLMNKMRKIQVTHKVGVKKILTDEQEMKLEQRTRYSRNKGQGANRGYNPNRPYHRSNISTRARTTGSGSSMNPM